MLLLFPKDYLDRRTRRHILEQCSKPFSDSRQDVEAARSQVLIQYVSDDPGNPLSQDLPYLTALATHREGVAQPNLFATLVRLLFQNWNSSTDKYASLTPSILRVLIKDEKNLKKAAKDAIKGNDSVLRPYMEVLRILISETRFERYVSGTWIPRPIFCFRLSAHSYPFIHMTYLAASPMRSRRNCRKSIRCYRQCSSLCWTRRM